MSFRHTLGTLFTMRPFDVSYGDNLSSLNTCKFKKKHSHFHRYEKRNLFAGPFSVHSIIIAALLHAPPVILLGEFLQIKYLRFALNLFILL